MLLFCLLHKSKGNLTRAKPGKGNEKNPQAKPKTNEEKEYFPKLHSAKRALLRGVSCSMHGVSAMVVAIIVMLAAMLLTAWAILGLDKFRWELKRLNMEIKRSTGEERKEWRALRRKLWLSLLPFFKY